MKKFKFFTFVAFFATIFALQGAENPIEKSKPIAWYDASNPKGVTKAGDIVKSWIDLSKNNNDASVPTNTTGPKLINGAINKLSALQFNGENNALVSKLIPAANKIPRTILTIARPISTPGRSHLYLYGSPNDGTCYGLGLENGQYQLIYWNRFKVTDLFATRQAVLLIQQFDGVKDGLAVNDKDVGNFFEQIAPTGSEYSLHIGARISPAEFFNGLIGEMVVFDRKLEEQELNDIRNFLIKKWGIMQMNEEDALFDEFMKPKDQRYKVKWWGKGLGLMRSPRDVGYIDDVEYCRQGSAVLKKYLAKTSDKYERLAIAMRLAELRDTSGFEVLIDALDKEKDPIKRGSTIQVYVNAGIADYILTLLGNHYTYDPEGSAKLRRTVINRWRKMFKESPEQLFVNLQPKNVNNGVQNLKIADINWSLPMDDMEFFYFLSGSKIYSIGAMNGAYPLLGRMLGSQSGIWAQPYKLLDYLNYEIKFDSGKKFELNQSKNYTSTMATINFDFECDDLMITRTDFVVENEPILFSKLEISNNSNSEQKFTIDCIAGVNLRPGSRVKLKNDLDELQIIDNQLIARDSGLNYSLILGGSQAISTGEVRDNQGILSYEIVLAPHEKQALIIELLGAKNIDKTEKELWQSAMNNYEELKSARQTSYDKLFTEGVQFTSNDADLDATFRFAKLNLKMLTLDSTPFVKYPYFMGGMPDYPELFGTDSCFSMPGMLCGGFHEMSGNIIRNLMLLTRKQLGKAPHETLPSGEIVATGNLQETPQFITAAWHYICWTGDQKFLKEVFPIVEKGIELTLKSCGNDGKLYPKGYSLGEEQGLGNYNIDTVCYLYEALVVAKKMSELLGDKQKAAYYGKKAIAIEKDFDQDWWDDATGIWANAIDEKGKRQLLGYINSTFPLNVGLGTPEKAARALKLMRERYVNTWIWTAPANPKFMTCAFHNSHFGMSAFNFGDAEFGYERMKLNSKVIKMDGLGAFENTNPVGDDLYQLWGIAGTMELFVSGLGGFKPEIWNNRIVLRPNFPEKLDNYKFSNVQVGNHLIDTTYDKASNSYEIKHISGGGRLKFMVNILGKNAEEFELSAGEEYTMKVW